MPAQNSTVLKSYFETNDQPTQQQFGDLVDSLQEARDNGLAALTAANNANVLATAALAAVSGKVAKTGDTMTGALVINGSADTRQLVVKEHSTQTSGISFELRANDATPFFTSGSVNGTAVVGYSDVTQLRVLAIPGQTVPIFQVSTSAGASVLRVNATTGAEITGRADAIQLKVLAHSTQTSVITQVANNVGATIQQLYNTGHLFNSGRIMLGGETASFPALKHSGSRLHVRLANDSFFAGLNMADTVVTGVSDVVQLKVNAVAGQTDKIFVVNDEVSNENFTVDAVGQTKIFTTGAGNVGLLIDVATSSFPCEFRVNGVIAFQVSDLRRTYSPQGIYFGDLAEVYLASTASGCAKLTDLAETGWDRLQFGGTSASFPALKRVLAALHVKLANDSGYAALTALDVSVQSTNSFIFSTRSKLQSPLDGRILLLNQAGSDFDLLQFGGTTASFPALKRSAATLQVYLADGSTFAALEAMNVTVDSSNFYGFTSRAKIYSPADGIVRLADAVGTDFNRLQFGGTSNLFPSLKRSGAALHARLANDSDYANFTCKVLSATEVSTALLTLTGGLNVDYTVVSAAYLVLVSDRILVGSHATVGFTITLPTAASADGQYLSVKNRNNAPVTVAANGAEQILTSAFVSSVTLNLGESMDIISDGIQWLVL